MEIKKKRIYLIPVIAVIVICAILLVIFITKKKTANQTEYTNTATEFLDYAAGELENIDSMKVVEFSLFVFGSDQKMGEYSVEYFMDLYDTDSAVCYRVSGNEDKQYQIAEIDMNAAALNEWNFSDLSERIRAIDLEAYLQGYDYGYLTMFDTMQIPYNFEGEVTCYLYKNGQFEEKDVFGEKYRGFVLIPANYGGQGDLNSENGNMTDGKEYLFLCP